MVEALFDNGTVRNKAGEEIPIGDVIKNVKFVCIYLSMHNCPPCRKFTPLLADLYNEFNSDEKQFEVIFLSGDKTQEQYDEYYADMPWLALPRGDSRITDIATKFQVKGVPRLIVLKPDGTVISDSAVDKVSQEGPGAIEEFLNA